MSELERMHEERINALDRRVDLLSQKVDDFIAESRRNADRQDARMQQLEQRMDAMNQRMDAMNQRMDATITALTQRMDETNQRTDATLATLNQRMDDSINQIRNLTIAATGGIVTIAVAVLAFVAMH